MDDIPNQKGVERFADAVRKTNARRFTLDKSVSLFTLGTVFFGAAITIGGWLIFWGSFKQSYADEIDRVKSNEIRLVAVESGLVKTNLEASEMRGDIKEILAILHRQEERRGP